MFNFKKANQDNNQIINKQLEKDRSELHLEEPVSPINQLISKDRKPNLEERSVANRTTDDHTESDSIRTTEGAVEERSSEYSQHRSKKNSPPMKLIDVLSEAYNQKYQKAYEKSLDEEKKASSPWDEYVGSQMLGETTKIKNNIKPEASQLPNNPSRFKSFDGVPHDSKNIEQTFESFNKDNKIEPLKMAEKINNLKLADRDILGIYINAYSNDRDLSEDETQKIAQINDYKKIVLADMFIEDNDWYDDSFDYADDNVDNYSGDIDPDDSNDAWHQDSNDFSDTENDYYPEPDLDNQLDDNPIEQDFEEYPGKYTNSKMNFSKEVDFIGDNNPDVESQDPIQQKALDDLDERLNHYNNE